MEKCVQIRVHGKLNIGGKQGAACNLPVFDYIKGVTLRRHGFHEIAMHIRMFPRQKLRAIFVCQLLVPSASLDFSGREIRFAQKLFQMCFVSSVGFYMNFCNFSTLSQ